MGGAQPTQSCTRTANILANPQTRDYHNASFEFLGVDSFRTPSVIDSGINNIFTLNLWVLPTDLTLTGSGGLGQIMFQFGFPFLGQARNSLTLRLEQNPSDSQPYLSIILRNANNLAFKVFRISISDFFDGFNLWSMLTITWNGSSLLIYKNNINITSNFSVLSNLNGSLSGPFASVAVGSDINNNNLFFGLVHQVAFWSKALTQDEIRTIWGKGSGNVNLRIGQDGYTSQNDLQILYLAGKDVADPFFDFSLNGRSLVFQP